jgi:phosphoglycerate dehydrogenase-like enzyme
VDTDALAAALDDGRVALASLDVTEPEPLPAGHPFYSHPRVHLSPHISTSSPDLFDRVLDIFLHNLQARHDGRPLTNLVHLEGTTP